jgi:hypothetical protein
MKKAAILLILLFVVACTEEQRSDTPAPEETPVQPDADDTPLEDEPLTSPEETQPDAAEDPATPESAEINLIVSIKDGKPTLVWTKHDVDFKGYKIVSSTTTSSPEYPTDNLVKTIGYADTTTFTDPAPDGGVSYYRVVAIDSLGGKTRSNVAKVELPNTKETPDQELNLKAEKTDSGVMLSWDKYEGKFLFYKVVWTTMHPDPKYPDDKTLTTIAYVDQTTYTATKIEPGVNYYAITVVRPDKTRFTSNRVSITN